MVNINNYVYMRAYVCVRARVCVYTDLISLKYSSSAKSTFRIYLYRLSREFFYNRDLLQGSDGQIVLFFFFSFR